MPERVGFQAQINAVRFLVEIDAARLQRAAYISKMLRLSFLTAALCGLVCFSTSPASAQHAGDRVFDTTRVHTINVVFSRPWAEVEPILKTNKEAEIYIAARVEINCLPPDTSGCVRMDSVGVRFKGNSSYSSSRQKNPFRFSFDEYGIDQRWDGLKGFVLNNGWNDATFAREKLHYDFARRAGFPGPRATYTWLYVNGERFAFYLMVELVDKRMLESRFGDKDGDRFKATDIIGSSRRSDFTRRSPFTPAAYYGYYEANSDDTTRAWQRMSQFIDGLNVTSEDSIAAVFPSLVNVDDLYRAIGADILLGNTDNYIGSAQNFNTYFPSAGGPMRWIIWDVSLSFGSTSTPTLLRNGASRPLTTRFMNNVDLKQDYLRSVWFMYKAHLADDWILRRIDSLQGVIMPHVEFDTRRVTTVSTGAFTTLKTQIATRRTNAEGSGGFASSSVNINAGNAIRKGDVVVNEFSPTSGWIEIFNARSYSIDLSGHSLTNDPAQPKRWTFPLNTFVAPRKHILVKLQGGTLGTAGPTNFTLPTTGGHLRLTRADSTIVDSVTYAAVSGDSSIGRTTDGATAFKRGTPTPGTANLGNISSTGSIAAGAVVINEFMADNTFIAAPSGAPTDWIELYNKTTNPLALSGAFLSDNATNPGKWQFPAGTNIAANGYLVVWAYDTTVTGVLLARWSLSKDGEHIRLSNTDLSVIDSVTFGLQIKDRSTARIPNGTGSFANNQLSSLGLQNPGGVSVVLRHMDHHALFELRPGLAQVRLDRREKVRLAIYDAKGREVTVLWDEILAPGLHTAQVDATTLSPGTYLFQLRIGTRVMNRHAVILK